MTTKDKKTTQRIVAKGPEHIIRTSLLHVLALEDSITRLLYGSNVNYLR